MAEEITTCKTYPNHYHSIQYFCNGKEYRDR